MFSLKKISRLLFLAVVLVPACQKPAGGPHLISNKAYREQLHSQFLIQKELAAGRDSILFHVFDSKLSRAETEGLEFLYAYMPLSDLAMNDGEYYLKQVRTALQAKAFFKWGADIPEAVFLHFVLPYRVNNEYTDTARQVFFDELKNRIAHLSMEEAALEVNHWCHEKVIYKASDERTSGPLTTMRTAFGRCGEESTFTVSAMRAVGIPARQVYTPRWAHSDDNHAWVEVWINGSWHFLGACEPEPALDMAWFAEPAKRAMMAHTFVFGKYSGTEEVTENKSRYAKLNLLKNYSLAKELHIKVSDKKGKAVADAKVQYGLYNYAEFYPISTQFSDRDGNSKLSTGIGDLLIHVSKNGISATAIARSYQADTLHIQLGEANEFLPQGVYEFVPPPKQTVVTADPELASQNNRRLLQEDSIRNIYTSTFIDSTASDQYKGILPENMSGFWKYYALSRGNWHEINQFVKSFKDEDRNTVVALLENISEKDLHDILAVVLEDHFHALSVYQPIVSLSIADFNRYVLSPRIGREFVSRWRSVIQQLFTPRQAALFRNDPTQIKDWIANHIVLDSSNNYYGVPLSPEGSLQLGRTDSYSRNVLFVAISRSFGIAARLEPATGRPQFFNGKHWNDVFFDQPLAESVVPRGNVIFRNLSPDPNFIPRYYTHFTIGKYENGSFVTLDYENDTTLLKFPATLSVDTGFYRLITGNRQSGGEVIVGISYFNIKENETQTVDISLFSGSAQTGVLGKADLSASFTGLSTAKPSTLQSYFGKHGLVVALIDPSKEPTKHLMEDIKAVKAGLDRWGGKVLFVVAQEKLSTGFSPATYRQLPQQAVFGHDASGEISASVSTVCSVENRPQWPALSLINPKGEIVWFSEGYSIGLGDQLMKQIEGMKE